MDYKGRIKTYTANLDQSKLNGRISQFTGSIKRSYKEYRNVLMFQDEIYMFKDDIMVAEGGFYG